MTSAIVITGASSGIGAALAGAFAADGPRLVLTGRDRAALESVAARLAGAPGGSPLVWVGDLADPDAPEALLAAVSEAGLRIETLVNNAGHGLHGPAAELSREGQLAIVDVNVRALTDLTLRVLPDMVAHGRGGVLNVASVAAFVPGPYMAAYYASKAFVLSFSEALAEETRGTGVTVTALCPGPTRTDFGRRAGFSNGRVVDRYGAMTAEDVAAEAHRAYRSGRRVVITGARNRWAALLGRYAPRRLVLTVIAAAQRKRET